MVLKNIYQKIYNKIFSISFFKKLIQNPIIEKLFKYETISYLFFGILTTVVNILIYWVSNKMGGTNYETRILFSIKNFDFRWIYMSNAIAWIVAVLFAYITNKLFVFESRSFAWKNIAKELVSFVSARLFSFLVFEELLFGLLASFMNSWIVKFITTVLVFLFNYFASKLVVFKQKNKDSYGGKS